MKENELLKERLLSYARTDAYPFHMPGHKRKMEFPNPFLMDITEIEGFDNLHHPEGILKESMDWASKIYGSDRTWYLINGSSSGILASISAAASDGGQILIARNCHKAAYHGLYLNGLEAVYLYPQTVPKLGIQGGILPEDVEKQLEKHPKVQAVLVVSPTYDGIVSDIHKIAEIVHQKGLPLIVDEAHGAHFPFGKEFPESALSQGADVVIQSVHKTLPSLTQTAVIHMNRNLSQGGPFIQEKRLEWFLQVYQSSSPSYVLLSSIENSIFQMNEFQIQGKIEDYVQRLKQVRSILKDMKHLRLVDEDFIGQWGIYSMDPCKILVSSGTAGCSGKQLMDMLRDSFHLEMEMCGADYVTAISTVMDSQEGLERLWRGFCSIDRQMEKKAGEKRKVLETMPVLPQVLTIRQAMDQETVPEWMENLEGKISGEFIYIYPPGIPLAAPGERITAQAQRLILEYIRLGLPLQGIQDHQMRYVNIIKG